MFVLKIPNSIQ